MDGAQHRRHGTDDRAQTSRHRRRGTDDTAQAARHRRHGTDGTAQTARHRRHGTDDTAHTTRRRRHGTDDTAQTARHRRHGTYGNFHYLMVIASVCLSFSDGDGDIFQVLFHHWSLPSQAKKKKATSQAALRARQQERSNGPKVHVSRIRPQPRPRTNTGGLSVLPPFDELLRVSRQSPGETELTHESLSLAQLCARMLRIG